MSNCFGHFLAAPEWLAEGLLTVSANVVASTRYSRRIYDFRLGNRTIHLPNGSTD